VSAPEQALIRFLFWWSAVAILLCGLIFYQSQRQKKRKRIGLVMIIAGVGLILSRWEYTHWLE
jgi:hypothetical protein